MKPQPPPDDGYDRFAVPPPPPAHPPPLGYEAPRDQAMRDPPPNGCAIAFFVVFGFVVTWGLVTIGSIVLFMSSGPGWQGSKAPVGFMALSIIYGLLCVTGIVTAVLVIQRPGRKSPGRWLLIGCLLGLGVGTLLGGLCFVNSAR